MEEEEVTKQARTAATATKTALRRSKNSTVV
jgi:hypothetical protein